MDKSATRRIFLFSLYLFNFLVMVLGSYSFMPLGFFSFFSLFSYYYDRFSAHYYLNLRVIVTIVIIASTILNLISCFFFPFLLEYVSYYFE